MFHLPKILFLMCCFCLCFVQALTADSTQKKIIQLGWDIPSTGFLRENYQKMEENSPFRGVMYSLEPKGLDPSCSRRLFTKTPWNRADYAPCIEDLKSCKFRSFTDNFLLIGFNPAEVAWDDEDGWKILLEKTAICAWAACQSNSKGIAIDFESYFNPMFRWDQEKQNGRTFAEAKVLARKRGGQFMQAIVSEFPHASILGLWLTSLLREAGETPNPDLRLAPSPYGLLPAFINGMLAEAPETVTFIDGCETGYYLEGEQYAQASLDMLLWSGPCMKLIEPELRGKYRAQVQCGFGFYLDMYSNPEGSKYYRGPLEEEGLSRFARLSRNLKAAVDAADQYVWVYGEKNCWWKRLDVPDWKKPNAYWEEALPGLTTLILTLNGKDFAIERISERIANGQTSPNLLKNPSFDEVRNGKPAEWNFWQEEKNPVGTGRAETLNGKTVVSIQKCTSGSFHQAVDVKDGEIYFFRVKIRSVGNAKVRAEISWQNQDGWVWKHTRNFPPSPESTDEWQTICGIVSVPPGMTKLFMLLAAANQDSEEDLCSFDDAELYRLTPPK